MNVRGLPSLDELAAHPERVTDLPPEVVKRLLVRHAAVGELLLARLIETLVIEPKNGADRFLDAADVATIIGKSISWIDHNLDELPAPRRLGGERKWSERELLRWMQNRPRWDDGP